MIIQHTKDQTPYNLFYPVQKINISGSSGLYKIKGSKKIVIQRVPQIEDLIRILTTDYTKFCFMMERCRKFETKYLYMDFPICEMLNYKREIPAINNMINKRMIELESSYSLISLFHHSKRNAEFRLHELLLDVGIEIMFENKKAA